MGALWSTYVQAFPPKPKWSAGDMPNLSGKVVIVTGGNAGIGKETVKALLSHNATVYMAARSESKASAAINELKSLTGKEAIFLKLDLANLKSVKAAAEEFISKETKLHVLFNNGGVMMPPADELTVDGYDLQFGTNVLGHFFLTKLLLPLLISTKSKESSPVRVVNVSSVTHLARFGRGIDFATLGGGNGRKKKALTSVLYFQSKYGNIVFAQELARRYGNQGIVSTALNPGNLRTDIKRHLNTIEAWFLSLIFHPVPLGALTSLYAGTSPEGVSFNGQYLIPWAQLGKPRANDPQLGKELWDWMEEQVKDV